ncbi:hypothetical protein D9M69_642530 [compost metagenome]
MAVTATDFCCAATGAAIAIANAMAPTVRKCFFPISIGKLLEPLVFVHLIMAAAGALPASLTIKPYSLTCRHPK